MKGYSDNYVSLSDNVTLPKEDHTEKKSLEDILAEPELQILKNLLSHCDDDRAPTQNGTHNYFVIFQLNKVISKEQDCANDMNNNSDDWSETEDTND